MRMSHVFEDFLDGVVARDVALGEFAGEGKVIQPCHAHREAEAEPPLCVVAAGKFDLHVPLAFARPQGQRLQRQFVNFERDGHVARLAVFPLGGKRPDFGLLPRRMAGVPGMALALAGLRGLLRSLHARWGGRCLRPAASPALHLPRLLGGRCG